MHEPITIRLDRDAVKRAAIAGVDGHILEIAQRFMQTRVGTVSSWDIAINEGLAQAAVTKWLNGRQDVKARSALKDYGNLIITDQDSPGAILVLVTCLTPVFRIEGFIRVSDAQAMKDCERETMGGRRWWIAKSNLRDPRELANG